MARLVSAPAVLIVLVSMVLAACGGDDDAPEETQVVQTVASLEETEPSETPVASTRPRFDEGLLLFTACLRDMGIEAPDIPVDPDGRPILSSDLVEQIDTESPEFAVAFASCVPFLTAASPVDLGADPELQAVIVDSLRRFSSCMRQNGVEEFPDPAPGWDGNGSPFPVAEAFDTSDPDVDAALEECSKLISFPSLN